MNFNDIDQFIEKIQPAMDKLAEKMGATSQFIWELLIKQVYVSSVGHFIVSLASLIILILSIRKSKKPKDEYDNSPFWWTCLAILSGCIFLYSLFNGVARIINPPYYVIEMIINSIQGQ